MKRKPHFTTIAGWTMLGAGLVCYFTGLFHGMLYLCEKGYHTTIGMFGVWQ